MNTVLRVEHLERGCGPYRGIQVPLDVYAALMGHNSLNGHPSACTDDKIMRYAEANELFGFADMDQLEKWFDPDDMELLYNNGYGVVSLTDIEVTAEGDKQVLFIKNEGAKSEILYDKNRKNPACERSQDSLGKGDLILRGRLVDTVKEYVRSETTNCILVIIRTNTYCKDLEHLNMLAETQKLDFPCISPGHQRVVLYGGRFYRGTMGVEARVPLDTDVPNDYNQRERVELIR